MITGTLNEIERHLFIKDREICPRYTAEDCINLAVCRGFGVFYNCPHVMQCASYRYELRKDKEEK
ncbi:hypothetical protein KKA15_04600 [Patescibacteria group bacterium]|nr:hypothetical protein [Patescibacteria group bacterium]